MIILLIITQLIFASQEFRSQSSLSWGWGGVQTLHDLSITVIIVVETFCTCRQLTLWPSWGYLLHLLLPLTRRKKCNRDRLSKLGI